MNVFSMHALIGAYKPEGFLWLDELRTVLNGNIQYACNYIEEHFQGVDVARPQGTYMNLPDFQNSCLTHETNMADLAKAGWNVGVMWQEGKLFNAPWAMRMNLALPLTRVKEAFERLDKYIFNRKEA